MGRGIDRTFQVLAKTKNKSAAVLLESALSSSDETIRRRAKRELLLGRGGRGVSELIRKFDPTDRDTVDLLQEHREKAIPALRASIVSKDRQLARNALRIARTQQFFELIPLLLTMFLENGEGSGEESFLADSIIKLTEKYAEALETRRNRRQLYGTILPSVLRVLGKGIKEFRRNDPKLILQVFLCLYPYITDDESGIVDFLRNTSHPAYLSMYHLLFSEEDTAVYQFVFYCMDNAAPPPIALTVFSKRSDVRFLSFIFKQVQKQVSEEFARNLKRISRIDWLEELRRLLDQLGGDSQIGLVRLILHLDRSSDEIQSLLIDIFRHGNKQGRREALTTLAKRGGDRVEQVIWQAADDYDPEIQSEALILLKERNLPKANAKILQLVESPHPAVRETVQKLLPEFRLSRFLASFDQMSDEQRRAMFKLVQKLDPQAVDELAQLLILGDPLEKARALLCTDFGELVGPLEESLCAVLGKGESPALRAKAAKLLADGRRELSRGSLVQALHRDPSPEVRAAAKHSLEQRPAPWEIAGQDESSPND